MGKNTFFGIALAAACGAMALVIKGLHMAFYVGFADLLVRGDPLSLQLDAIRGVALIAAGAVCALITVSALLAATFIKERDREAAFEAKTSAATSQ